MRTDELIAMLAREPRPADAVGRRYAVALAAGGVGSVALMFFLFGPRPDLAQAVRDPAFWLKLLLPAALAAAALGAVVRLGRPGRRVGYAAEALLLPVGVVWMLAAYALFAAAPGGRLALVLGETWTTCALSIALLSLPVLASAFWAMRGLAPTRPALAGAASGLLAGAVGAVAYSVHCPEIAPPFLGTWYVLGMALPAAAGALAGPRLLRW